MVKAETSEEFEKYVKSLSEQVSVKYAELSEKLNSVYTCDY
jgi:hypothetical protein